MDPVIQEEKTGCGIASCAAITGLSYPAVKAIANRIGIFAEDRSLWSDTAYIRQLLAELNIETGTEEEPFTTWDALPDLALLAIKWREVDGVPFWHWTVFVREGEKSWVLDSKKALKTHRRSDFGRITPKWYIPVNRRERDQP